MFKRTETRTPQDNKYQQLWYEALDAESCLQERARRVLVSRLAVELYPDGPDKKKAEEDLLTDRRHLLTYIGHYDGRLWELTNYYRDNSNNFVVMVNSTPSLFKDSHKVIEEVCRERLFGA